MPRSRAAIGRQNKRRGNEGERHIRKLLVQAGYRVTKAGGSLGAADLIAGLRTHTLAIQVKTTKPTKKERRELVAASKEWWVDWVLIWKEARGKWKEEWFHFGLPNNEAKPILGGEHGQADIQAELHGSSQDKGTNQDPH